MVRFNRLRERESTHQVRGRGGGQREVLGHVEVHVEGDTVDVRYGSSVMRHSYY
jgi:hypothetical protein